MRAPAKKGWFLLLAACAAGAAWPATATPAAPAETRIAAVYDDLPLSFEVNVGQVDRAVDFLCRSRDATLFVTRDGAVLSLHGAAPEAADVVRVTLTGKALQARRPGGVGLEPQATMSNYFVGNDPRRWHTAVTNYSRVLYPGVYPGIDLVYHGSRRRLGYDFVVAPGADPRRIRLAFAAPGAGGAPASVTLGAGGELILHAPHGDVVQPAPTVYQERAGDGRREAVAGRYVLLAAAARSRDRGAPAAEVGFSVGSYDRSRLLIIDPAVVYTAYLGGPGTSGTGGSVGNAVAVDAAGSTYVTGQTSSTSFTGVTSGSIQPTFGGGVYDAFVTKLNAAGTAVVYSTFLGGSGSEQGNGIAVDGDGNAYVTGSTTSTDFPLAGSPVQPVKGTGLDAFVTKLNSAGTGLVYSTFLGGNCNDWGYAIKVDGQGNAYVAGTTCSTDFPGVTGGSLQPVFGGGNFDGFVAKLNPAGSAFVYSTFLGGSNGDEAFGIALDGAGDAYVTGYTASATFPGVTGSSLRSANTVVSAFVTEINAAGTATIYSTFLGGSSTPADYTAATAIAVDAAGSAYLTGYTTSAAHPGAASSTIQPVYGGSGDAFATKLNPSGSAIVYSTYLGGSSSDIGKAIALDAAGNAYVTGNTSSTTFTGVNACALQPTFESNSESTFVTEVNAAGTATVYSTYLGDTFNSVGYGIAADAAGNAYLTGARGALAYVVKISGPGRVFFTLAPCRVFDTRGGTPMSATEIRSFQVSGACGIPASASSVTANLTVVGPQSSGYLTAFPGDAANPPLASNLNSTPARRAPTTPCCSWPQIAPARSRSTPRCRQVRRTCSSTSAAISSSGGAPAGGRSRSASFRGYWLGSRSRSA